MEMRSECERCQAPTPEDGRAFVCSFECTWCPSCAAELGRCPNCGGELVPRPRRGDPDTFGGDEPVTGAVQGPFDLALSYPFFEPGPAMHVEPIDDAFWATIGERSELHRGRLMVTAEMNSSWERWERHPHADEVVGLLSGRATLIVDTGEAAVRSDVGPAQFVVVPQGAWHTLDVAEPGVYFTVTWGEGTEGRVRESGDRIAPDTR